MGGIFVDARVFHGIILGDGWLGSTILTIQPDLEDTSSTFELAFQL